jgi:hypothetical protein
VERYSDIDFSRAFVCKSGGLISYLYRKAHRLPVSCFHNIEGLQSAIALIEACLSGIYR